MVNSRLKGLNNFAFKNNADANSIDTQAEYLWHELNTTHSKALDALRNSKDVNEATVAFTDHFEKPKSPNYQHRVGLAERALNLLVPTANADERVPNSGPIYADTLEEARAAKAANPNAQIFIKEGVQEPSALEMVQQSRNKDANPETSTIEAAAQGAGNFGLGGFADEIVGAGILLILNLLMCYGSLKIVWMMILNNGPQPLQQMKLLLQDEQ